MHVLVGHYEIALPSAMASHSTCLTGMWHHMSLFFDDRELSLGYAIVASASEVNGIVGGPIAAGLMSMNGLLGLKGWQWLFLIEGIPAVGLGAVLWCRLVRTPSSAWFLTPAERSWLAKR